MLLASILPGIPFIVARWLLHGHSGLINLDYLLLTLLACFGSTRLASVLFVFTYIFESLRIVDAVYLFSQEDLTFAAHFLGDVPKWIVALWLLAFVVLCAAGLKTWRALLPRRGSLSWRAAATLLAAAAVLLTIDFADGFIPFLRLPHGKPRPHLVGEVLLRMPIEMAPLFPHQEEVTVLTRSATDPLWSDPHLRASQINRASQIDIVVVVVESMGLLRDKADRAREFAPFDDPALQARYLITIGSTPFRGPTISGEMRELCHLGTGTQITGEVLAGRAPCLPQQFNALGYQTVAFHGYRGAMFHRADWYPLVGFQQTVFLADMKGEPMCNGAFYGVCDAAIAAMLDRRLAAVRAAHGPPQFLYWMTLNGHLPVDTAGAPHHDCPVTQDREVCAQMAYNTEVLTAVKSLAMDPAIGPTVIIIVGDHAPPYLTLENRDLFEASEVPSVLLEPRPAPTSVPGNRHGRARSRPTAQTPRNRHGNRAKPASKSTDRHAIQPPPQSPHAPPTPAHRRCSTHPATR